MILLAVGGGVVSYSLNGLVIDRGGKACGVYGNDVTVQRIVDVERFEPGAGDDVLDFTAPDGASAYGTAS